MVLISDFPYNLIKNHEQIFNMAWFVPVRTLSAHFPIHAIGFLSCHHEGQKMVIGRNKHQYTFHVRVNAEVQRPDRGSSTARPQLINGGSETLVDVRKMPGFLHLVGASKKISRRNPTFIYTNTTTRTTSLDIDISTKSSYSYKSSQATPPADSDSPRSKRQPPRTPRAWGGSLPQSTNCSAWHCLNAIKLLTRRKLK